MIEMFDHSVCSQVFTSPNALGTHAVVYMLRGPTDVDTAHCSRLLKVHAVKNL